MLRYLSLVLVVCLHTTALAAAQPHSGVDTAASPSAPLADTLGTYHHPITTTSSLAQRYFDQGLRLLYGFDYAGAIRSFQEATRLDPHCAMAHWGIALALGPNINSPMDAQLEKTAYNAIQRAFALAGYASEPERAYIEALAKRYAPSSVADRTAHDRAYADAMRRVTQRYPDDLDAATLFADALMNLHPWEYWTPEGQPQPDTPEIVETLEKVLQQNPEHPGVPFTTISMYSKRRLTQNELCLLPGASLNSCQALVTSHICRRIFTCVWDCTLKRQRVTAMLSIWTKAAYTKPRHSVSVLRCSTDITSTPSGPR